MGAQASGFPGNRRPKITGERVVTPAGGFNPTWQRHVAAYARFADLLPSGRVLDLGCGVGHSHRLLAPRETVGVDIDAGALAGQDRQTVQADMRDLPLADASFASVICVHAIEHIPDPERAVAEAARVLEPAGIAVFVTPNRLTFGRPDEIIDPYHEVEFDADELRALCSSAFADVELRGLFGSAAYRELFDEERRRLDRLLALDPLRLRRAVPKRARRWSYDRLLRSNRRREDPRAEAIGVGDFELGSEGLAVALDVCAICRGPHAATPE